MKTMVSTRSIKYKFNENEKVLCYEPDPTKAKVLYDSKVLEVIESKDKRGKKLVEYLIHFQGWNSSWDRRVCEDFVLKDTEENRQLQKDLAKKSQLQLGAYLYRKDRKKRKRNFSGTNESKSRIRCSSEDGSSCSRDENDYSAHDESESYSSSVESSMDDERVVFRLGQKLKEYLENDYTWITMKSKLIDLPAKIPVVTILENFVKHYSIRAVCCPKDDSQPISQSKRRRRNSQYVNSRSQSQKQSSIEDLTNDIELCKEVADGLRIYFDFTLYDYLLYSKEKEQANLLLSENNLKNFTYLPSECLSFDILSNLKPDSTSPQTQHGSEPTESVASHPVDGENTERTTTTTSASNRRRLRSYNNKNDDSDYFEVGMKQENCISSIASTSSDSSTLQPNSSSMKVLRKILPLNIGIPVKGREILQKTLMWEILPANAPAEPSMLYGASHLARLLIKLPDFLNASTASDEKMKYLLKYLDCFIEFIENHSEWFDETHYKDRSDALVALDCEIKVEEAADVHSNNNVIGDQVEVKIEPEEIKQEEEFDDVKID